MSNKKPRLLTYKRKRQGKTNYRKRLHLLLAKKTRLIIRLTNKKIITQLVDFKTTGDQVLIGVDSSDLKKYSWPFSAKSLPAAYLTGYLLGKKALQKKIKEAVLDLGLKKPIKGNKIYACLKGAVDAGLNVPHSEDIFPDEKRISGKHIQDYAQKIKATPAYQKVFSGYLKNGADPAKLDTLFQQAKKMIQQEK